MFVHDFVTIPLPLARAMAEVSDLLLARRAELVRDAWAADAEIWIDAGLTASDLDPQAHFDISLGVPRVRFDAAVIHFSWDVTGARLIPSLDADIELAARGTQLTDLQLLGRYRFPIESPRTAIETSIAHRAVVAAVRRLLVEISAAAVAASGPPVIGPATSP